MIEHIHRWKIEAPDLSPKETLTGSCSGCGEVKEFPRVAPMAPRPYGQLAYRNTPKKADGSYGR